ncbi:hypothetical protein ABFS82_04G166200 [Erythranthe guttata]|nr:PREDICTED: metalloendoproteinase 1-like [Erythranthe guttata]|eukprot:XP_012846817.1 PREDICTED: metalloendoproteinase 1-like [Erythranthe guttata]
MTIQVFSSIFFLLCLHTLIVKAHLHESNNNFSTPFDFLNRLSGVAKGDNVKGVRELKNYLSSLGYLNHDSYPNDKNKEHENIFDDSLEIALKKYQEFYDLNITGFLDPITITKMRQPRCGMPDFFIPNKTTPPFHTRSYYTFLRDSPKWYKKNLSYSFDWNVLEGAKQPLEHALKQWASATPFKFHYVKIFRKADIKFSFMSGDHDDGYPFVGSSTGMAHSFPPPDGRIHFDVHRKWAWVHKKNAYDMQTVGLHELGHALGLDHSTIFKAVMYPIIYPGERKGLHKDDIDGIKALYKKIF